MLPKERDAILTQCVNSTQCETQLLDVRIREDELVQTNSYFLCLMFCPQFSGGIAFDTLNVIFAYAAYVYMQIGAEAVVFRRLPTVGFII